MFESTRIQQEEAAWLAIKQREEAVALEKAKEKAARHRHLKQVLAWESDADDLLGRGRELFSSDKESLKAFVSVVDRRAEAREQQAIDVRENLRKFYAVMSIPKAITYAVLRGVFIYAPLCLLLAIFLEICRLPTVVAGGVAITVLGVMVFQRFKWIRSMRQDGQALSGNEAEVVG